MYTVEQVEQVDAVGPPTATKMKSRAEFLRGVSERTPHLSANQLEQIWRRYVAGKKMPHLTPEQVNSLRPTGGW